MTLSPRSISSQTVLTREPHPAVQGFGTATNATSNDDVCDDDDDDEKPERLQ